MVDSEVVLEDRRMSDVYRGELYRGSFSLCCDNALLGFLGEYPETGGKGMEI
jgi:hypothetical protein